MKIDRPTEGSIVGYFAGGESERSVIITSDGLRVLHGDRVTFEISGSAVVNSPIGIVIDQDQVGIGAGLPEGFTLRRLIKATRVRLSDLAAQPPIVAGVTFRDCEILGPCVVTALRNVTVSHSVFPRGEMVYEMPAPEGEFMGLIGLVDCNFDRCAFQSVGFAVPPGQRAATLRQLPRR